MSITITLIKSRPHFIIKIMAPPISQKYDQGKINMHYITFQKNKDYRSEETKILIFSDHFYYVLN